MPQFQVEPRESYEGTYTDDVMFGSSISDLQRVGSSVNGYFPRLLELQTEYGEWLTLDRLGRGSGNVQFVQMNDTARIVDSTLPSIEEVSQLDASGPVLLYVSSSNQTLVLPFLAVCISVPENGQNNSLLATSDSKLLSSQHWLSTPPFSQRYKNVRRTDDLAVSTTKVTYKASSSFRHLLPPECGYDATERYLADITPVMSDTTFWSEAAFVDVPSKLTIAYVRYTSNPTDINVLILGGVTGSVNISGDFITTGSSAFAPSIFNDLADPVWPRDISERHIAAHFFGVGAGPGGTVKFLDENEPWLVEPINGAIVRFGYQITGWKYGIYNGFPASAKQIVRSGRYGMLRDVLEQRIFTKERRGLQTVSPVTMTFTEGTESAFSASLGISDSGFYDFECKRKVFVTDI
jgi:hypothetical protein